MVSVLRESGGWLARHLHRSEGHPPLVHADGIPWTLVVGQRLSVANVGLVGGDAPEAGTPPNNRMQLTRPAPRMAGWRGPRS